MAENGDSGLDEFLAIRKPGAHPEEDVVPDDFVLQLRVDLKNYPKFRRVDDATDRRGGGDSVADRRAVTSVSARDP
jgi:hypothetical protein